MCMVCRRYPCDPRCPNAAEPKARYKCERCGYGIDEGEEYYDSPEGYICRDCISNMTIFEFMEMIGESLSKA